MTTEPCKEHPKQNDRDCSACRAYRDAYFQEKWGETLRLLDASEAGERRK